MYELEISKIFLSAGILICCISPHINSIVVCHQNGFDMATLVNPGNSCESHQMLQITIKQIRQTRYCHNFGFQGVDICCDPVQLFVKKFVGIFFFLNFSQSFCRVNIFQYQFAVFLFIHCQCVRIMVLDPKQQNFRFEIDFFFEIQS